LIGTKVGDTTGDLERPNSDHFVLFDTIRQLSESTASNSLKLLDPYYHNKNVA